MTKADREAVKWLRTHAGRCDPLPDAVNEYWMKWMMDFDCLTSNQVIHPNTLETADCLLAAMIESGDA